MQSRVNVITLAVEDLDRALAFYRDGLGFPSEGILGSEHLGDAHTAAGAVAMFRLDSGLLLCLYPRRDLALDAHIPLDGPHSGDFSVGHAVGSRDEVDGLLARAAAAGARVTDAPHERPWGIYSGYFLDLDGHLWEVIWDPDLSGD
jgi:catechol 2,3-dioxygenase-like lactoylglutathione lyase family enzyme